MISSFLLNGYFFMKIKVMVIYDNDDDYSVIIQFSRVMLLRYVPLMFAHYLEITVCMTGREAG